MHCAIVQLVLSVGSKFFQIYNNIIYYNIYNIKYNRLFFPAQ